MPGVINTSKSIYQPQRMPDQPAEFAPGPDEVEEDEPDREGNTDPGTNAAPDEDNTGELFADDPEVIRKNALAKAAKDVQSKALAVAGAGLPKTSPAQHAIHAARILFLDMREMGDGSLHYRLTMRKMNGENVALAGYLKPEDANISGVAAFLLATAK